MWYVLDTEKHWNQFMANKENIRTDALELLNVYYDWWVLGIGKEKSEPLEDTTRNEWNKFNVIHSAIFLED